MKIKLLISAVSAILLICIFCAGALFLTMKKSGQLEQYRGKWKGTISEGSEIEYDLEISVYVKGISHAVQVSSSSYGFHNLSVKWNVEEDCLTFYMNDSKNRAVYRLNLTNQRNLTGTMTQYGNEQELSFNRISGTATYGKYYSDYPELTYKQRKQQLTEFSEYAEDDVKIPFTYDLNNRTEYEDLINEYDLDSVTAGYQDVELMKVLLYWVSDHFKHNGNSGLPNKRNAVALIDFYKQQSDGINCRGLAIILSELLRVYGIPAKHITCMPKEAKFQDCHVVVHAYSEELKQWIMLDPTYKLILQDENGNYVNLSMLRDSLIKDRKVIANEDAGRNGGGFDLEEYRQYMTKNTFRFSSATDFYFGAENGRNGNKENILVPLHYEDDPQKGNTTSEQIFWAIP